MLPSPSHASGENENSGGVQLTLTLIVTSEVGATTNAQMGKIQIKRLRQNNYVLIQLVSIELKTTQASGLSP